MSKDTYNLFWSRKHAVRFIIAMDKLTDHQKEEIMKMRHSEPSQKLQKLWIEFMKNCDNKTKDEIRILVQDHL